MMYFIVKIDLVRMINLIEYTLYMYIINTHSTMYFTVNTTQQHYLVSYFDIMHVMS